jgi:uncharacterized protein
VLARLCIDRLDKSDNIANLIVGGNAVHFVIHAVDRPDALATRAKHYRAHRVHLDEAGRHGIAVTTAGTLVAADGQTPVGSLFILEAQDRAAIDGFTESDPYHLNGVWERVDVHYYNKKR